MRANSLGRENLAATQMKDSHRNAGNLKCPALTRRNFAQRGDNHGRFDGHHWITAASDTN